MKKIIIGLAMISAITTASAEELSAEAPYIYLGSNSSHSMKVYGGAFGTLVPLTNKNGITLIRDYHEQVFAENGTAEGAASENLIAVDCQRQMAKYVTLRNKAYTDANVIEQFNTTGDAYTKLESLRFSPVQANSILALVVDYGCAWVRKQPSASPKPSNSPKVEL